MNIKRVLATLGLLFIGASFAYAQNPYKSLGVEIKPLTLSKGKFVEFFPNDSLVQIGSIILDTRTNSIVSFVVVDTAYSEATLEPELTVRFLQPDPLASEYPNLSPYAYVANNPLMYVDPTGMYIVDSNGNRVDVVTQQDEDGNYYNTYTFAEGTEQSVIDDFHANGGVILGAMALTEEGRTQIGNLIDTEHSVGFTLSSETIVYNNENGGMTLRYGITEMELFDNGDGSFSTDHAQITVYKGTAELVANQKKQLPGDIGLLQKTGVVGIIGKTGAHEAVHASDPVNMSQVGQNQTRHTNYNVERAANLAGARYTYQFLLQRKRSKK